MENWSKWKLVKAGFWLGLGFIIPQLFVMYSGTILTMFAMPAMVSTTLDSYSEDITLGFDRTDQIEILEHREQKTGNRLLILGSIANKGDKKASSIRLEAEFMDKNGSFVFECSEYINKSLMPGDVENYQIKCGCGDNPVPEYSSVNVRIVSASQY